MLPPGKTNDTFISFSGNDKSVSEVSTYVLNNFIRVSIFQCIWFYDNNRYFFWDLNHFYKGNFPSQVIKAHNNYSQIYKNSSKDNYLEVSYKTLQDLQAKKYLILLNTLTDYHCANCKPAHLLCAYCKPASLFCTENRRMYKFLWKMNCGSTLILLKLYLQHELLYLHPEQIFQKVLLQKGKKNHQKCKLKKINSFKEEKYSTIKLTSYLSLGLPFQPIYNNTEKF